MSLILIKMALQSKDFSKYSKSTQAISAIYAATAFLKHSQEFQGDDATKLVNEIRGIIFNTLEVEKQHLDFFMPKAVQDSKMEHVCERSYALYKAQFDKTFYEKIAIDIVDFEKVFDTWHCGLN